MKKYIYKSEVRLEEMEMQNGFCQQILCGISTSNEYTISGFSNISKNNHGTLILNFKTINRLGVNSNSIGIRKIDKNGKVETYNKTEEIIKEAIFYIDYNTLEIVITIPFSIEVDLKFYPDDSYPDNTKKNENALRKQAGGSHYKGLEIQPAEYCQRNGLNYCESNVIKYVTRHRSKNGIEDIEKAIHCLEILKELEYKQQ